MVPSKNALAERPIGRLPSSLYQVVEIEVAERRTVLRSIGKQCDG